MPGTSNINSDLKFLCDVELAYDVHNFIGYAIDLFKMKLNLRFIMKIALQMNVHCNK